MWPLHISRETDKSDCDGFTWRFRLEWKRWEMRSKNRRKKVIHIPVIIYSMRLKWKALFFTHEFYRKRLWSPSIENVVSVVPENIIFLYFDHILISLDIGLKLFWKNRSAVDMTHVFSACHGLFYWYLSLIFMLTANNHKRPVHLLIDKALLASLVVSSNFVIFSSLCNTHGAHMREASLEEHLAAHSEISGIGWSTESQPQ